jgi:hypothetical protein
MAEPTTKKELIVKAKEAEERTLGYSSTASGSTALSSID